MSRSHKAQLCEREMRPFLRQGDMPSVSAVGLMKHEPQKKGEHQHAPLRLFFILNEKFYSLFVLQCRNFRCVIGILISRIKTRSE